MDVSGQCDLGGLKPGLLQKYQQASTASEKFSFFKAFMLDESMSSVEVEVEFVNQSLHDDAAQWVELPLSQLEKIYTTESERRFLQEKIVGRQEGRAHPQDPDGADKSMRLYWAFRECADTDRNRHQVGARLSATGAVPGNKAARQAVVDGLTTAEADFAKGGKGKSWGGGGGGKGPQNPEVKAKAKAQAKAKAGPIGSGCYFCCFFSYILSGPIIPTHILYILWRCIPDTPL